MSTAQQPKGLPVNVPAPVGTSPTDMKAIADGNKASGTNVAQQPKNTPVPVENSPTVHAIVDSNKSSETTQQPKGFPVNAAAPVGPSLPPPNAIVDTNKLNGTNVSQQPEGLPVSALAPVGINPTIEGNKPNGTQEAKGLPVNTSAPVGTSPTVQHTIVDSNKPNESNGTQQAKGLSVDVPASVVTHPTVSTGLNAVAGGNEPLGTHEVVGGNNVSVQQPKVFPVDVPAPVGAHPTVSTGLNSGGGNQPHRTDEVTGSHNVLVGHSGDGHSSSQATTHHSSKLDTAIEKFEAICHEELEVGFGVVKGLVTEFEKVFAGSTDTE